ncbi:MAG: hypothetical protein AB9880_10180 [Christensenellales bacterium]
MKRIAIFLILLCLALPSLGEQTWAPEGVDIGGSRTPVAMPEGVALSEVYPEFVPSLPEGYHLSDALYDGQAFILLYREAADGSREILMSVVQEDGEPHALTYVEGSYEASGGSFLYFMLINGKTRHGSLYLFSLRDERMNLVLGEPCSNNMALFQDPPEDLAGLGYVAWQDLILPIVLSEGSSYEGGAATIADLGGLPGIGGDFFGGAITKDQRKYTFLTPLSPGILQLNTVIIDTTEKTPDLHIVHTYDCLSRQLVQR